MSDYENAPATRLLATHCCLCGRPLVDAKSVERGVGPDCAERHGFDIDVPPAARAEANRLVYEIATGTLDGPAVLDRCRRLLDLGFRKLAETLVLRTAKVVVTDEGDRYAVSTPYDPRVVALLRRVPGRHWENERQVNTFPKTSREQLWSVLRTFFRGEAGIGPRGPFVIA